MAHNDAPKATQRLRGDANDLNVCSVKVLICICRTTFNYSYPKDSLTAESMDKGKSITDSLIHDQI